MKTMYVSALVCAVMALATAAAVPEETPENGQIVKSHLVKRSTLGSGRWTEFNRRYFYYVPQLLSWAQAERNCQSLGGNLASVHSLTEYHTLQMLVLRASHKQEQTWIGGSDGQQENYWFWSDGTSFQYTNWCTGEPNNAGGRQSCLLINFSVKKCWDDQKCTSRLPSICAK
ncbi:ladderlectin-like [Cottoperca gobio]|uniref:Ladderlectin-like n=1 Tax=Cottoperca gobio TaxID=56716 RepID=A0A6J2RMD2_COTGO|nr:ladderlectin-like [Cottoperca gobio]